MTETTIPDGAILTRRQLNRALLARQHLLTRGHMPIAGMLERLVGMQSQVPNDPYIGLWSRVDDFDQGQLSALMLDRSTVRASLMRGTIHLVTADDYILLQPLMYPLHERGYFANDAGRKLDRAIVGDVLAAGRELLGTQPLTAKVLGAKLAERWPDSPPTSLAQAIRFLLPLVQVTPRGVWGKSQQATWALAEEWLGKPVPGTGDAELMVERYLAAFGPATVADAQAWSGLTGLRPTFEAMRCRLRTFRNERGQELFDVPDGTFVDPDTPAPVRFLPGFENALLSHKDRSRIISEERRKAIGSNNGLFLATYLVDGFVAGTWKIQEEKERAFLNLVPFGSHDPDTIRDLEEEGDRLLAFVTGRDDRVVSAASTC